MQAQLSTKISRKSSLHSTSRLGSVGTYQSTQGNTQEIESLDKAALTGNNFGQEQQLIR